MTLLFDLGSSKVAGLVCVRAAHGGLEALAAAEAPCRGIQKGVVADLESVRTALDDVARRLRSQVGELPERAVVNLNGSHLTSLNTQGFVPLFPNTRAITREDVLHVINHSRQISTAPDTEQIQAIPREFRVDGIQGVQKPIGLSGSRLEVVTHIVTGSASAMANLETAVGRAGFKIDQVITQPVASGLGVSSEDERDLGLVVIDLGAATTTVAIFQGGALAYSAVMPMGSSLVTSDLSKLLKTSPEEAERLKIQHGCAIAAEDHAKVTIEVHQVGVTMPRHLHKRVLSEIVESRMREVAQYSKQQVEKSGLHGLLPGGVLLTGGGSLLPGVEDLFAQVMPDVPVRLARPRILGPQSNSVTRPQTAALIGMAEFALTEEEDEIQPANGLDHWKSKIKTLKALFKPKES
jgi:cell division protein FtsA